MKLIYTLLTLFIGTFLIQYFIIPAIMVNKLQFVTNHISKAYVSVIMGLFVIMLEVIRKDYQYNVFSVKIYTFILAILLLFIYLYKKQIFIDDKQYLEKIIEQHSIELQASEEILKKTNSYDVTKIAKNIIQQDEDDLRYIKSIITKH
jgi:hypothetical protein